MGDILIAMQNTYGRIQWKIPTTLATIEMLGKGINSKKAEEGLNILSLLMGQLNTRKKNFPLNPYLLESEGMDV